MRPWAPGIALGLRGGDLQRYGNAGPLASGELDEAGGMPLAQHAS